MRDTGREDILEKRSPEGGKQMVLDGHSDLLYDVWRRRSAGETHVLTRRHLKNLREGGVEGLVLSLWAHPAD